MVHLSIADKFSLPPTPYTEDSTRYSQVMVGCPVPYVRAKTVSRLSRDIDFKVRYSSFTAASVFTTASSSFTLGSGSVSASSGSGLKVVDGVSGLDLSPLVLSAAAVEDCAIRPVVVVSCPVPDRSPGLLRTPSCELDLGLDVMSARSCEVLAVGAVTNPEPEDNGTASTLVVVFGDEGFTGADSEAGGVATAEPEGIAVYVVLGKLPSFMLALACATWLLAGGASVGCGIGVELGSG